MKIKKGIKVILLICVWLLLIIIVIFMNYIYFTYISGMDNTNTSIKMTDDEKRFSRPYKYIDSINSSNINSIEDLYLPKHFNNNNVTIFLPKGQIYSYCLSGESSMGNFTIYRSNGSKLDRSIWINEPDSYGYSSYSALFKFEGDDNVTLKFVGTGKIIFLSQSISDIFEDSLDYSGTIGGGLITFHLPRQLTDNLPEDKRIVAEMVPEGNHDYTVRFYDENLHFLGEVESSTREKEQIPSGFSYFVFVVVKCEENISFRFYLSSHIEGRGDPTLTSLCGGLIVCYVILLFLIIKTYRVLKGFNVNNKQSNENSNNIM